ncbi:LysR family transcriptional regulator [Pasteurella canis]|uniref:LysR family transcriptional regulator n=1 Tax=Pasteurella canis TaxID=753 RepID=UPI000D9A9E38|nr:LysR family transcriptional regulator [Pasteurella canis]MXN87718.1 LysR family transcriptional regulator [Pasteurella canis]UAY78339.1 LysR family transcriptional regulator [Pasteurella canis]UDW84421.1 LysR family transcriptional regulator [Pasteurella canis]SPY33125.1 glycine cleavage system transcriptional activator [Pasteurella canis]GJJ79366.1 putative HTH-type transcriptional regulator [Pasteurella canis]
MDKLNAISIFCKVVETQSFTQAAAQQNISVAMASKLVAQLEEQLKVRLLQRTTRKISPTEAGLIYYQHCQPILVELEDAESSISNLSTSLQGNLSISVPRDFGLLFITPNLAKFVKDNPNLHIDIEFNDRIVDLVAESYDIALRIGYLQDSSLVAKRVASVSTLFVASPEYLAKRGIPKAPDDLQHHDCLLYKAIGNQIYWEFNNGKQIQRLKMNSKLICNNGLTLTELAKSGLGIINTPRFFVENELRTGELIEIFSEYQQQKLDINLVYPHRRHLPAKTKAFIEFIQALQLCPAK